MTSVQQTADLLNHACTGFERNIRRSHRALKYGSESH